MRENYYKKIKYYRKTNTKKNVCKTGGKTVKTLIPKIITLILVI